MFGSIKCFTIFDLSKQKHYDNFKYKNENRLQV